MTPIVPRVVDSETFPCFHSAMTSLINRSISLQCQVVVYLASDRLDRDFSFAAFSCELSKLMKA